MVWKQNLHFFLTPQFFLNNYFHNLTGLLYFLSKERCFYGDKHLDQLWDFCANIFDGIDTILWWNWATSKKVFISLFSSYSKIFMKVNRCQNSNLITAWPKLISPFRFHSLFDQFIETFVDFKMDQLKKSTNQFTRSPHEINDWKGQFIKSFNQFNKSLDQFISWLAGPIWQIVELFT